MQFDSVGSFHAFVDDEMKSLSAHNHEMMKTINKGTQDEIEKGTEWYGTPAPKSIAELDNHISFMEMHLMKEVQPKVKDHLSGYLRFLDNEVMPKPKLSYNDRGLGMFSFDRAAMGLYKNTRISTGTPIDMATTQLNIELGRKHTSTSVKKVFAWFENKQSSYPSLRLYIMAGANANIQGNQLLYVGLACGELIDFLEARGVAVEVNVLLGTSFDN